MAPQRHPRRPELLAGAGALFFSDLATVLVPAAAARVMMETMQIISGFRHARRPRVVTLFACLLGLASYCAPAALALEHVTLRQGEGQQTISGQVVVTAEDGGLLLLAADGTLWAIEPDDLIARRGDDQPFKPLSRDELSRRLLEELPEGFEIHATRNYLICYNTSRAYATWCGALFERLYKGFTNYWSRKGMKLEPPRFPLVAIVFNSRQSYSDFSRAELGDSAESIVGYYSLRSNRVLMYDLTGVESLRAASDRRGSAADINRMLARPAAEQAVATVIHEATHQIAFNSGLQRRFADVPLWVSEGIAVYFETPDLGSSRGWRTIGAVNTSRLAQFRRYLARRPPTSLKTLISDDTRIRDTREALDAYAEAWALNYYLLHHHPRQYAAYLQMLARKQELLWDDPQTRLKEFQAAFGDNLGELDADFLRQMQKLR